MMGEWADLSNGVAEADTLLYSVFLVTVHDPVCTESGDLSAALYGSFLPVPSNDLFPLSPPGEYAVEKRPGAVIAKKEAITINQGRERVKLRVTNNGDRPIQVRFVVHSPLKCHNVPLCRLVRTITSSKPTQHFPSTAPRLMASALTSPPVPPSASSPAT